MLTLHRLAAPARSWHGTTTVAAPPTARIARKLQPGQYWLSVRHKDGNATGVYSVGATTRG